MPKMESSQEREDGCLAHPVCLTCTYSKCFTEAGPFMDRRFLRYKIATMLKNDLNIEAKSIGHLLEVTPNHVYKILREDWSDYI